MTIKPKYEVLLPTLAVSLVNENPELIEAVKSDDGVLIVKLKQEPYENVMVALYNMEFEDETDDNDMVDFKVRLMVVSIPNDMKETPSLEPNTPLYLLIKDVIRDIIDVTLEDAKRIISEQE